MRRFVVSVVVGGSFVAAVACSSSGSSTDTPADGGASTSSSGASGSSSGTSGSSGGEGGADANPPAVPGWPDATNTGVPDGACPNGLRAATSADIEPQANAVITCVKFDGELPYLRPEIANVTYKNCRFETKVDSFLNIQGPNLTIEDSDFAGASGTWIRTSYEGKNLVVRRCDFSGMANAVEFGPVPVTIEDNFVHDFGNVDPEQHADGFQNEGSDGAFVIRHNTILMQDGVDGATSALLVGGEGAIIENNLVAGAGYTVHVDGNVRFAGNHFSTMFHDTCGFYGPVYPSKLGTSATWENNVWHDGPNAGKAIDAPSP